MASGVDLASPFVERARLQEPHEGKVRCLACERACLLAEGGTGWCRTRVNRGGVLYSLIYGALSVWSRCRQARALGLHLEITSLIIPGVNDDEAVLTGMAERMATDLGAETPWHLSGYYPAFRFEAPPTPLATLERAWAIGRRAGLLHVYLGNVPGHPKENTYCPGCGELLIERRGFSVARSGLDGDRCSRCGRALAGVGWEWGRVERSR